jgi:hypothetical protein
MCHLKEELYESKLKQAVCDQTLGRSPIAALKVCTGCTSKMRRRCHCLKEHQHLHLELLRG